MNWKSEHLSRFYDDWGTLKLFKKRETKQIFVWFYFHLTRFLLIDKFVPLVDWISGPEGKSTSQSTRYSFYMQSFRTSFMQKFPSVIDVNKKNLSEEGGIEDSSTYLTPLSIPAPIDSFASNSEELVKKFATIDRSPIFLSVNDLDELRSYNLTDSDSKEEQFNFSYIWIDCLVKTINQYCEANNINGWMGSNSLPQSLSDFWPLLRTNLGKVSKFTYFCLLGGSKFQNSKAVSSFLATFDNLKLLETFYLPDANAEEVDQVSHQFNPSKPTDEDQCATVNQWKTTTSNCLELLVFCDKSVVQKHV